MEDIKPCTIGDLVNVMDSLCKFGDEKLSLELCSKIVKLKDWIQPTYDEYIDFNNTLLRKTGKPDEKDVTRYSFANAEVLLEYKDGVANYLAQLIKIPNAMKLRVSDIKDIQCMTPFILFNLRFALIDF